MSILKHIIANVMKTIKAVVTVNQNRKCDTS